MTKQLVKIKMCDIKTAYEKLLVKYAELEKENEEQIKKHKQEILDLVISNVSERAELEAQIEKMKCCENCKYNSYWGNELHCNYGMKEALQEDKLVECKNMDKWEIKEND